MGIACDFTSSSLICAEESSSILCFNNDDADEEEEESTRFYEDFLMDLPPQSEECVAVLVERETQHLPGKDYADSLQNGALMASVRRDAIAWILKVHHHYKFGASTAYLSANYLDRFLSICKLPHDKAWMAQLLSVACLSLAAKVEEREAPLPLDLQVGHETNCMFESKTIQRMELLVLTTLKWRMQAVTPFSLIDYYLSKLNHGKPPTSQSVSCSVELILSTIADTKFLEFRPSEVAAAVALLSLGETHVVDISKDLITCCFHLDEERVLRCYQLVKQRGDSNPSPLVSSGPQSPSGVLDAACLSYRSDEATAASRPDTRQASVSAKRRRLSCSSL